jgi:hypothetical protein
VAHKSASDRFAIAPASKAHFVRESEAIMKLPEYMPSRAREMHTGVGQSSRVDGLRVQGCNVLEWAQCAAQVAACTASTGGIGLIACLAAVAPNCVKCVS